MRLALLIIAVVMLGASKTRAATIPISNMTMQTSTFVNQSNELKADDLQIAVDPNFTTITISNMTTQTFTFINQSKLFKADDLEIVVDPTSVPANFHLSPQSTSPDLAFQGPPSPIIDQFSAAFFANVNDPNQGVVIGGADSVTFLNFVVGARVDVAFTKQLSGVGNYITLPTATVPEIDPGCMAGALALLSGGVLMLTDRRRRRSRGEKGSEQP